MGSEEGVWVVGSSVGDGVGMEGFGTRGGKRDEISLLLFVEVGR